MNMNIDIRNVRNANELDAFNVVSGEWELHCLSDDRSEAGVIESVRNYMDAVFPVEVRVFHADGRAITGDMPSHGTFVAVRER